MLGIQVLYIFIYGLISIHGLMKGDNAGCIPEACALYLTLIKNSLDCYVWIGT